MTKRTITSLISLIIVIAYSAYLSFTEPPKPQKAIHPDGGAATSSAVPVASPSGKLTTVTRVVDGDTIVIESGEKVRYIGVNTPESVDPRRPVECFGKEASAKNKELVAGKQVLLEKDVSDKDRYGRLLRYVWLGDTMINDMLVREGYAQVDTVPPDVKQKDRFIASERVARDGKLGLWGASCN